MPRKIRQLEADLHHAGFQKVKKRGKGDHGVWQHPLVRGSYTLDGDGGADAFPYQERHVMDALAALARAQQEKQQ